MNELEQTGAITVSEWNAIREQASHLAKSEIVPRPYRGKPDDIIAAALMGREVGWSPMLSLKYIDVIEGNATISAEGMTALVRGRGHSIKILESSPTSATVYGKRADNGDEQTIVFTIEDKERAGLGKSRTGKPTSWDNHPEQMLVWRATSRLCRFLFPDAIAGLGYTPDEGREIAETEQAFQPLTQTQIGIIRALGEAFNDTTGEQWEQIAKNRNTQDWEAILAQCVNATAAAIGREPLDLLNHCKQASSVADVEAYLQAEEAEVVQ